MKQIQKIQEKFDTPRTNSVFVITSITIMTLKNTNYVISTTVIQKMLVYYILSVMSLGCYSISWMIKFDEFFY